MWASPSKVPTNISLISSGIVISALWADDKRTIPFVELAALRTVQTENSKLISGSC